jgi:hypothetical protein
LFIVHPQIIKLNLVRNDEVFYLGSFIRLPLPLFSVIANSVKPSVEIFSIAITEKELRSSRAANPVYIPFVIIYTFSLPLNFKQKL